MALLSPNCTALALFIALSYTTVVWGAPSIHGLSDSQSIQQPTFLVAATKKKQKKKSKPIDVDTASGENAENPESIPDESPEKSAKETSYVSTRPPGDLGPGSYALGVAKSSKTEIAISGNLGSGNKTSSTDSSSSTTKTTTPVFLGEAIFPLGILVLSPAFGFATFSATDTDESTRTGKSNSTSSKATHLAPMITVAAHGGKIFDIGVRMTYSLITGTTSSESYTFDSKYNYLRTALLLGAHSSSFETSLSYTPGGKAKGTVTSSENTESTDSEYDLSSVLEFQGRYRFIPSAFGGLIYNSNKRPYDSETTTGLEFGYILDKVQLGILLELQNETQGSELSERTTIEKTTKLTPMADFKSKSAQTFSIGLEFSSGTTASESSSGKTSSFGLIGGGHIQL